MYTVDELYQKINEFKAERNTDDVVVVMTPTLMQALFRRQSIPMPTTARIYLSGHKVVVNDHIRKDPNGRHLILIDMTDKKNAMFRVGENVRYCENTELFAKLLKDTIGK